LGDESVEIDSEMTLDDLNSVEEENVEKNSEILNSESTPMAEEDDEALSEEIEDDGEETSTETTTLKIKMTMLLIGIGLAIIGISGVIGLRTGIIQPILGYSNPSPGVGPTELMAQIVSIVPLVIGMVLIGFWGIKNDPIYNEIEKLKEDGTGISQQDEVENLPEEFIDAVEDLIEDESEESVEPEQDIEELKVKELLPEIGPEITSSSVKDEIAEEIQMAERCEKMLRAIVILPEDKPKLRALIDSGVSVDEFTEAVKEAVHRRKEKEKQKDITANEKASILEDELVAELAELEDGLNGDNNDKELEDEILREIEDLESL